MQGRFIWIKHSFEGFHKYINAPDEVQYLKNKHRHIFHLKVWIEVFHNDREIEFHMFKTFIKKSIKDDDFDFMSCEMISNQLYEKINETYPGRKLQIEVSEDNENGSLISYLNGSVSI